MTSRVVTITTAFFVAASFLASAQRLADEQSRREAVLHYRAGQEFMSAERFDRAAEEFGKAIENDRLLTLAHYSLGQAHMSQQRYGSAIKAFRDCIEAFRSLHSLSQANRFAVERQRDDDIREMRESVRLMQALAARNPGAGYALRATQMEQQLRDLENQRSSLNGAFRPPAEVLLSLGSAHFRNGDGDAAEAEWKAAVDVNPKLGEAHNNLAVVYMQTGRLDEAEAELKLAEKNGFRVNPQFKDDLKSRRKKP